LPLRALDADVRDLLPFSHAASIAP